MTFNDTVSRLDQLFSVLWKYEIHAFVLVVAGVVLCIAGIKDVGYALVTAGTTVFKGRQ
jgi:hypothetical protein